MVKKSEKFEEAKVPKESQQHEKVTTELRQIPFDKLVTRVDEFAFRDPDELKSDDLKALREDIAGVGNVHTPLLVAEQSDGTHLILDAHRRHASLGELIRDGVQGFTRDMLVPCNVLLGASELEMTRRAVSANINRNSYSPRGRARVAVQLKKLGMSVAAIATDLGVGESTVERDIACASDKRADELIANHSINYSTMASLMTVAIEKNKVSELCQAIKEWATQKQKWIADENKRRDAADKDRLKDKKLWPATWLKADQVLTWKNRLEQGQPLGTDTVFRYSASVSKEKGVTKIEIGSLSRDVADLTVDQLSKVYLRLSTVAKQIKPLIVLKQSEVKQPDETVESSEALAELRALGIIVEQESELNPGESAPDFDKSTTEEDTDLTKEVDE